MAIGAVLGGVGALMNIITPLLTQGEQPGQINPETEQRLQQLQEMLGQLQPQVNALGGQAQSLRSQQTDAANKGQRYADDSADVQGPGENDWFSQFLGNIPEYTAVAKEVSAISQQTLGRDITAQSQRDLEGAMRAAGDATAGQGFSGAASAAAGQAAGQVLGQAGLERQKLASDTFNNTFQNFAGQGQQLAFQDQQMQFQNALQALGQAMGGQFGASNAFGGAANNALSEQSNLVNLINGIQGNIQDITQPVYSSPSYTNKFSGVGNNIAALGQSFEAGQAGKDIGKGSNPGLTNAEAKQQNWGYSLSRGY